MNKQKIRDNAEVNGNDKPLRSSAEYLDLDYREKGVSK